MDMSLSKFQEIVMIREPGVLQSMGSQRVRHDLATELMCLYGETEVGCGVRDMGVDVWKDGSSMCV